MMRWNTLSASAKLRVQILAVLVIAAVMMTLISLALGSDWSSVFGNFGTELGGAAITFVLLDLVLANRERREAQAAEQAQTRASLIDRMGSNVREIAVAAADELRRQHWLTDGTLAKANLRRADLSRANLANASLREANLHRATLNQTDLWQATLVDADLSGAWLHNARLWDANLEGVNLWQARVQDADLRRASLENASLNECRLNGADLRDVNLRSADLTRANLQQVNLRGANLREADFTGARLQGADLRDTDLAGAVFTDATFDTDTIMPDGKHWSAQTDLSVFTVRRETGEPD